MVCGSIVVRVGGNVYLLVKVRWQMRKLEEQLRFVQDKQSDGILVSDIRILGIGKLTDSLNEILQKQRSNRQEWVQRRKDLCRRIPICHMTFAHR